MPIDPATMTSVHVSTRTYTYICIMCTYVRIYTTHTVLITHNCVLINVIYMEYI